MKFFLLSIIILSSWNLGYAIVGPIKISDSTKDLFSVFLGAVLFTALTIVFPEIRYW
ncbi:MAG: hypothetical protein KKB34_12650 [Bacteroidetes bacterium]|jgi:hypothetical protein|nr:hypothetical protein [Bacteroidota bacterium]